MHFDEMQTHMENDPTRPNDEMMIKSKCQHTKIYYWLEVNGMGWVREK